MNISEGTDGATSAEQSHLDELVRVAATGDRRAAGEYFRLTLPRLAGVARRIANNRLDPEDLLGEALLSVVSKWAEGTGPTGNVNAYMAKIMHNRVLDEMKSPRSRVRLLAPEEDLPADEDPRIRLIDADADLDLVRRALQTLPADQRDVLVATVLEGHKPGDLEERFARPAASIYSLIKRAKFALRRATLKLLLEEDARPECSAAARRLPPQVGDSPDASAPGSWSDHYRSCRRCRRVWARFASLSALGLTPLLFVGDLLTAPPASASSTDDSRVEHDPAPRTSPRTSPGSSPAPTTSPVLSTPPASTPPASTPPSSTPPSSTPPAPTSSGEGTTPAPAPGAARVSRISRIVGVSTAAIGVAIVGVLAVAFLTKTLWFEPDPEATITVDATVLTPSVVEFDLGFEVIDKRWRTQSLEVRLSESVQSVRPPAGWTCRASESTVLCTTDLEDADGGAFTLARATPGDRIRYDITLTTLTEDGATVIGTASGSARP